MPLSSSFESARKAIAGSAGEGGIDIDVIFDSIDKIQKTREKARKDIGEFNLAVRTLDLEARDKGFGRIVGDFKTGQVQLQPFAAGDKRPQDRLDAALAAMIEARLKQSQGQAPQPPSVPSQGAAGATAPAGGPTAPPVRRIPPQVASFTSKGIKLDFDTQSEQLNRAFKIQSQVRQTPQFKEFNDIRQKVGQIQDLVEAVNKGDFRSKLFFDNALVTLFNKITDPTSVVRESEFNRIIDNLPFADRLRLSMEKWRTGAQLTVQNRKDLLTVAQIIADAAGGSFNQLLDSAVNQAANFGVEANLITGAAGFQRHSPFIEIKGPSGGGAAKIRKELNVTSIEEI